MDIQFWVFFEQSGAAERKKIQTAISNKYATFETKTKYILYIPIYLNIVTLQEYVTLNKSEKIFWYFIFG